TRSVAETCGGSQPHHGLAWVRGSTRRALGRIAGSRSCGRAARKLHRAPGRGRARHMGDRFREGRWAACMLAAVTLAVGCGTASATTGPAYVVRDLTTGTEAGVSSNPGPFYDLGGTILFFAKDDTHGRELWRTDGRGAPVLVKDVAPGPDDGVA